MQSVNHRRLRSSWDILYIHRRHGATDTLQRGTGAAYLDDSEGDGDAGDVDQVGCELVLQRMQATLETHMAQWQWHFCKKNTNSDTLAKTTVSDTAAKNTDSDDTLTKTTDSESAAKNNVSDTSTKTTGHWQWQCLQNHWQWYFNKNHWQWYFNENHWQWYFNKKHWQWLQLKPLTVTLWPSKISQSMKKVWLVKKYDQSLK